MKVPLFNLADITYRGSNRLFARCVFSQKRLRTCIGRLPDRPPAETVDALLGTKTGPNFLRPHMDSLSRVVLLKDRLPH